MSHLVCKEEELVELLVHTLVEWYVLTEATDGPFVPTSGDYWTDSEEVEKTLPRLREQAEADELAVDDHYLELAEVGIRRVIQRTLLVCPRGLTSEDPS